MVGRVCSVCIARASCGKSTDGRMAYSGDGNQQAADAAGGGRRAQGWAEAATARGVATLLGPGAAKLSAAEREAQRDFQGSRIGRHGGAGPEVVRKIQEVSAGSQPDDLTALRGQSGRGRIGEGESRFRVRLARAEA